MDGCLLGRAVLDQQAAVACGKCTEDDGVFEHVTCCNQAGWWQGGLLLPQPTRLQQRPTTLLSLPSQLSGLPTIHL